MAWLKKYISKNSFLTISAIWNACSVYLGTLSGIGPELLTFITTVGNLVIAWLGVESDNVDGEKK